MLWSLVEPWSGFVLQVAVAAEDGVEAAFEQRAAGGEFAAGDAVVAVVEAGAEIDAAAVHGQFPGVALGQGDFVVGGGPDGGGLFDQYAEAAAVDEDATLFVGIDEGVIAVACGPGIGVVALAAVQVVVTFAAN